MTKFEFALLHTRQLTPTPQAPRMELWLLDQNTNIRQTLHVDADSIVIGRDSDCDVVLKGPFVAKRHARITRKGNQFFVDNVSRSGCRVANRDVLPGTPQRIDFGDEVQIAQFSLALIRPDDKRNLDKNTDRRELQKLLMTYEQQVHALLLERMNLRVTGHMSKTDEAYIGQILEHLERILEQTVTTLAEPVVEHTRHDASARDRGSAPPMPGQSAEGVQ